jgi:hypothetical protein
MHAWDEPAETLLACGSKRGVPLVMPRLGEPVEPAHVERVAPWWRAVERSAPRQAIKEPTEARVPNSPPWPMD